MFKPKFSSVGAVIATLCLLAAVPIASAKPRALIVGVGKYQMPNADLPGIDLDVDNMSDLAMLMGFDVEEIRILMDEDATLARVQQEMQTWLRDGVGADDPVFFYFSGHGTRIPDRNADEPDGADEVLVMHDSKFAAATSSSPGGLINSLVDDQIAEFLAAIPSRRVLVLIDACNSGTSTRDVFLTDQTLGQARGVKKFLYYKGIPRGRGAGLKGEKTTAKNFAALAAAEDTQSAIATDQGGVFTLGVVESVRQAAVEKRDISVAQLRDEVAKYIEASLEPELQFRPVVSGSAELVEGALDIVPLQNANGPTWRDYLELSRSGSPLSVVTNREKYVVGEQVLINIDVARDGFLNVISVDSQDAATVLFPNKYQADNKVSAGKMVLPSEDMPFTLPAQEPAGPTLVVAFLSDKPLSALDLGIAGRDKAGRMRDVFTSVSKATTRAIGVAAREASFLAGATIVTVESKQ